MSQGRKKARSIKIHGARENNLKNSGKTIIKIPWEKIS